MNKELFLEILNIDSTSGRERVLADFLAERLLTPKCRLERFDVESMSGDVPADMGLPQNLLFSWGEPEVIFCTHMDTVPPYIPPTVSGHCGSDSLACPVERPSLSCHVERPPLSCHVERPSLSCPVERPEGVETSVYGRGTCDAKGQIMAMYEACLALEVRGYTGFGLLLLAGEETGSFGAKAFRDIHPGADWLVVGEPTDNCMASASKGTKAFEVTFTGRAFHSGYPEYGSSAVEHFNDFMNALRSVVFPKDELLGMTTFNVGRLVSGNPQNILSDRLTCRVYFRTTFESDEMVGNVMMNMAGPQARLRFGKRHVQDGSDIVSKEVAQWQKSMSVKALGGDTPTRYEVLDGFPVKPVAFGSDAPQLTNFPHKILCGPGSILVAHRDDEHISFADLDAAVENYIRIYEQIKSYS